MLRTDLSGQVALVTGSAGGIGSAIAVNLAANGATVYLTDINVEGGKAVTEKIIVAGGKAYFVEGNVSIEEDCKRVIDTMVKQSGGIDILVNNTGGNIALERRNKIYKYEPAAWYETINMCMDGGYYYTRLAMPIMKHKGSGRIINIGSVTGFRMGLRIQAAYNMAKAAIHNITRCLAIECAPWHITVNCVMPGTTWHQNFFTAKDPSLGEKFLSHVPLHEPNRPNDIAEGVLFFASPETAHVTGVTMPIDGGWSTGYCKGAEKN